MSLRQTIQTAQLEALKSHAEEKLATLRMLWSAIKNSEIDKKRELTDEEIQGVVQTQTKQLFDALKDFVAAGRQDLIAKTEQEIVLLKNYLPAQLGDAELELIVKKLVAEANLTSPAEAGKVIGMIMKEVKGKADGNRVKELVNKLLSA